MKKKSLFHSVIALVLCLSMLAGTTFAWFTDTVKSAKNLIAAGNLNVELYHSNGAVTNQPVDGDTMLFVDQQGNPMLWEPGAVAYENLRVANEGDLALFYRLSLVASNENYILDPSGAQYGLSQILKVGFVENGITATDRDAVVASVSPENWTTLSGFAKNGDLAPVGAGESEKTWGVVVYWEPSDNDNLWNLQNGKELSSGDVLSIDLGVCLEASQFSSERDAFDDQYDAKAMFPLLSLPLVGSAPVTPTADNKVPTGGVTIRAQDVTVVVPEGTLLNEGVTQLTLNITEMPETESNVILGDSEVMKSLDIHVDGVAEENTEPLQVTIPAALAPNLNIGNYHFYHVEDGVTNAMVSVPSPEDLNAHNQFYYDSETGDVTLFMASFSEVVTVTDYLNPWKGGTDHSWYNKDATTLYIKNGDQLWSFSQIVGGMAKKADGTILDDNFDGKTVILTSDINLGDAEENNVEEKIFYPIGYYNDQRTYEKTSGGSITSNVSGFSGTFDGAGHTIADFYQNTWEMYGDYNSGYSGTPNHYKDAMGLFGYVYNGTVKNLTVENFSSDGEFTPTGVIAAYAANATFTNIAIRNCNPRVYNTGNGGIIGIAGRENAATEKILLENITVDNTNKITALWGSWDVACGGLVGMYRGNNDNSGDTIHFEKCHVGAQIDVYNDVCANYQYYAYRYSGMLIGSVRHNETINGREYPLMTGITASNSTVHFGDWNDYYYCELVDNTLASYTHDHQMSRLVQIDEEPDIANMTVKIKGVTTKIPTSGRTNYVWVKMKDSKGAYIHGDGDEYAECYHFLNGKVWSHEQGGYETTDIDGDGNADTNVLKEDKQHIYREFNNLITGYGWGVTSKGVEDLDGVTILDRTTATSVQKFKTASGFDYFVKPDSSGVVSVSSIFAAAKTQNENTAAAYKINYDTVVVSVTDITDTGITATHKKTDGYPKYGVLTFDAKNKGIPGMVKITIQDYQYCEPTTVYATVMWGTPTAFKNAGNAVNGNAVAMTTAGTFSTGGVVNANCPHCNVAVDWYPLNSNLTSNGAQLDVNGQHDHYYLAESISTNSQEIVFADSNETKRFCLHLNGNDVRNDGTDLAAIRVDPGTTLSIMGNGNVQGPGARSVGNRTDGYPGAAVDNRSILNLYGGTYASTSWDRPVLSMFGAEGAHAINIFNGTLVEGTVQQSSEILKVAETETEDDDGIDDGDEEVTEKKRSTAAVLVHAKNHYLYMYGGTIQNGNSSSYGGNIRVNSGVLSVRGGVIQNGSADRGGNIAVGNGGDGWLNVYEGAVIQNGEAYNLGGNIYSTNSLVMTGGTIKGGSLRLGYHTSSNGTVSAGSGGSIAVVGGVALFQGGTIDGTLPDGQTANAYFGALMFVARGTAELSGGVTFKNGKVHSGGTGTAISVSVIPGSSTKEMKAMLELGKCTVTGDVNLNPHAAENQKTIVQITGDAQVAGLRVYSGNAVEITATLSDAACIYIKKAGDKAVGEAVVTGTNVAKYLGKQIQMHKNDADTYALVASEDGNSILLANKEAATQ